MEYLLDHDDWQLAKRLAKQRDSTKAATCHNGRVSRKDSEKRHLRGLAGEIAFARCFGFDVDDERRPDGDPGYDFVAPCGATIDVKTRAEAGKDFALTGDDLGDFDAHCGVLVWPVPDGAAMRLVGWTTPTHLLWKGQRTRWGNVGRKWWVDCEDLLPIDILYDRLAQPDE